MRAAGEGIYAALQAEQSVGPANCFEGYLRLIRVEIEPLLAALVTIFLCSGRQIGFRFRHML